MSYMFRSVLEKIPKTRLEMVNDLEIPEVSVSSYTWSEPVSPDCDSLASVSDEEAPTVSSASSLALSRAMTDSEIDYGRHRRLRSRSFIDPWIQMRAALDAFPSDYLDSLSSFKDTPPESIEECSVEAHRYNEELHLMMEKFFEEECRVFEPDDPGLLAFEEALQSLEMKDFDIESTFP